MPRTARSNDDTLVTPSIEVKTEATDLVRQLQREDSPPEAVRSNSLRAGGMPAQR